jgi:hypothetical protein
MTIRHDEEHPNHVRPPSSFPGDQPGNDACLSIERGVECLHVRHPRLDLDQHESPSTRMPSEDIDRPTITEVVERVLDEGFPTLRREHSHHSLDQGGMIRVKESGYVGDRPSGRVLGAVAGDRCGPPACGKAHELEPSGLDIAYDRLVDTSARPKLTLRPAFPSSQRADAAPDGDVVHVRDLRNCCFTEASSGLHLGERVRREFAAGDGQDRWG